MGAESGISFNTAVKFWVLNTTSQHSNKDMIPPMVKVILPAAKSHPMVRTPATEQAWEPSQLPGKDIILACIPRFFEEVHSIYWLYSSEAFHSRLEATYSDMNTQHASSWLCSLHSIVSLGSLCFPEEQWAQSSLEAAKLLVPNVCDEADLDSIRALILIVRKPLLILYSILLFSDFLI